MIIIGNSGSPIFTVRAHQGAYKRSVIGIHVGAVGEHGPNHGVTIDKMTNDLKRFRLFLRYVTQNEGGRKYFDNGDIWRCFLYRKGKTQPHGAGDLHNSEDDDIGIKFCFGWKEKRIRYVTNSEDRL
jgi:hypothetical protein